MLKPLRSMVVIVAETAEVKRSKRKKENQIVLQLSLIVGSFVLGYFSVSGESELKI